MPNTKTIFCANCQSDKPHSISLNPADHNEVILRCECGRFIKVLSSMSPAEISAHLDLHREHNKGQITQESIDKREREIIESLADK